MTAAGTAVALARAPAPAVVAALELIDRLDRLPHSYFVQLAHDDRNAPLIRAGEIVVVDQGSAQSGGWLPTEGGLFVIEYRSGLTDYPGQRYPRVTRDIVQTFTDDRGRWWAGSTRRGVQGRQFFAACGPYADECALADRLIGKVLGLYSPCTIGGVA